MWRTWIVVAFVLFLSALTVAAADVVVDPGTETGEPVRPPWDYERTVEPAIEGEYDDIGGTPSPWAEALPPSFTPEWTEAENDSTEQVKAGTPTTASMVLASLDRESRMNALIELEPLNATAEASGGYSAEAMSLWNNGDFDLALAKIEQLEATGGRFAVAITWRVPITTQQPEIYTDRRIGGTLQDASDVAIDYHRGTGNIFIAVAWGPASTGTADWTLNMSSDGGDTWVETHAYYGSGEPFINMTVVDDFVYVAYVNEGEERYARLRRQFATTGASDATYGFHNVADVDPATVVDISLCSDADNFSDRIYLTFVDSSNNLRYFWDLASDGKTFTEASPSVSAEGGLDMHLNNNRTTNFIYVSYIGTDGGVHVVRRGASIWTDTVIEATYTGSGLRPRARVSAANDEIYVTYDHQMADGRGVKYKVSYNDGASWSTGNLYVPAAGEPGGNKPDVSNRSGWHTAILWNQEEGATDSAYHVDRPVNGSWSDPFSFSNYDPVSGTENYMQYIGSLCVKSYGMVYLAEGYIPYFDLMDYRAYFCDGFESNSTSAWD